MNKKITTLLFSLLILTLISACGADLTPTPTPPAPSASAILNEDMIYTLKDGEVFSAREREAFLAALSTDKDQFLANQISYSIGALGDNTYRVFRLVPIAEVLLGNIKPLGDNLVSVELAQAIENALEEETTSFEHNGTTFVVTLDRRVPQISTRTDAAIASTQYLEAYDPNYNEVINTHEFRLNLGVALKNGENSFSYDGDKYGILAVLGGYSITDSELNFLAELSDIYVIPHGTNEDISLAFKNKVREAIATDSDGFAYTDNTGQQTEYQIEQLENSWTITKVVAE